MEQKERRAYDDYMAYLAREMDILDTAKEEGLEKGREEGREIEKLALVTKILLKKFGHLSENQKNKVEHASMEQLDVIVENLFEITSVEELDKFL